MKQLSITQLNSKIILTVFVCLFSILAGCATTDEPSHKVSINSKGINENTGFQNQEEVTGSKELSSSFEAVYQYGNGRQVNKPIKRKYASTKGEYSMDFVNISVEEFVSIVFTELLKKNYVFDSAIKGDITVQTRGQVNAQQLLSIVESALASRNAVMVAKKGLFEIIPMSKAKNYSLKPELYSARNIQPGYRMVIVPVNFINPEDLKPILESVAPSARHLKIDKERRAIVITGSEQEISNVVDAVQIFDVSWLETKSIAVLPVKNTQASVIQKEISKILTSQNKTHGIVLDTIERFNALLVVSGLKKEITVVKKWLEILDVNTPTSETQLFVYEVQNRKASELADMLNNIFNEGSGAVIGKESDQLSKTVSTKEVVVTNKKKAKALKTSAAKQSELRIVADETNNAIVILAKEDEYQSIKSVIKEPFFSHNVVLFYVAHTKYQPKIS